MPSRRQLLAGITGAAVAGMAGCNSAEDSGGSDTLDCKTNALERGDGDVLDTAVSGAVEDDTVRLVVPLSVEDVRESDVDTLEVYDAADELAYTIPVSPDDADVMANKTGVDEGQLRYEQSLGPRPSHGRYRVVAVTPAGDPVDSITVELNCFADVDG